MDCIFICRFSRDATVQAIEDKMIAKGNWLPPFTLLPPLQMFQHCNVI